jgi:hypothetical protein
MLKKEAGMFEMIIGAIFFFGGLFLATLLGLIQTA